MLKKHRGGEGRIRTFVDSRRQIYSLLPLTARPPLHPKIGFWLLYHTFFKKSRTFFNFFNIFLKNLKYNRETAELARPEGFELSTSRSVV